MKIFLIGFMGSGKTTLGKRLATKLKYPFIDIDARIEAKIGSTIAEYFDKNGEVAFRQVENSVMKDADIPQNAVVATGGGAPCYLDNLEWMNNHGLTIYLSLSPKALAKRLENGVEQRPVLQNLKGEALEKFITEKLKSREPFYKQAKLILKGKDQTPERLIIILREKDYLK